MQFNYSIIVPVFNRPQEIEELLHSLSKQTLSNDFEVIIVEDGSHLTCEDSMKKFQHKLNIQYHYKENSGPGLSRNYGMQ